MKKFLVMLMTSALLVGAAVPASAKDARRAMAPVGPFNVITCGIWILPATCTPAERIVGTTLVGLGIGFGVGAIAGASGYTITGGSLLAAKGTAAMAWTGGAIGAGTGFVGGALVSQY